jgi:hypothetical protein
MNTVAVGLKVADETWIAAALLHREHPEAEDFAVAEIVERAAQENITGKLRHAVYVYANAHGVANRPPNPGQYRILFETKRPDRRRLFREGDEFHPKRTGMIKPDRDEIPEPYRYLLDWYESEYVRKKKERWLQGVFDMVGAGKGVLRGEDPDAYIRRLREGWE